MKHAEQETLNEPLLTLNTSKLKQPVAALVGCCRRDLACSLPSWSCNTPQRIAAKPNLSTSVCVCLAGPRWTWSTRRQCKRRDLPASFRWGSLTSRSPQSNRQPSNVGAGHCDRRHSNTHTRTSSRANKRRRADASRPVVGCVHETRHSCKFRCCASSQLNLNSGGSH